MTLEELEALVSGAAREVAAREPRPIRPTVVLPSPTATSVTTLEDFPDDDLARFDYLSRLAADRIRPAGVPCYGFIAEASLDAAAGNPGDRPRATGAPGTAAVDVLVAVFGARRRRPQVMAATWLPAGDSGAGGGDARPALGDFTTPEPLDPTAMPFLTPLQHAVDAAEPPDVMGGSVLP